ARRPRARSAAADVRQVGRAVHRLARGRGVPRRLLHGLGPPRRSGPARPVPAAPLRRPRRVLERRHARPAGGVRRRGREPRLPERQHRRVPDPLHRRRHRDHVRQAPPRRRRAAPVDGRPVAARAGRGGGHGGELRPRGRLVARPARRARVHGPARGPLGVRGDRAPGGRGLRGRSGVSAGRLRGRRRPLRAAGGDRGADPRAGAVAGALHPGPRRAGPRLGRRRSPSGGHDGDPRHAGRWARVPGRDHGLADRGAPRPLRRADHAERPGPPAPAVDPAGRAAAGARRAAAGGRGRGGDVPRRPRPVPRPRPARPGVARRRRAGGAARGAAGPGHHARAAAAGHRGGHRAAGRARGRIRQPDHAPAGVARGARAGDARAPPRDGRAVRAGEAAGRRDARSAGRGGAPLRRAPAVDRGARGPAPRGRGAAGGARARGGAAPMIRGYPRWPSVRPGETLTLHVSTDQPAFRAEFSRQGATLARMTGPEGGWLQGYAFPDGPPDRDWGWPGYEFAIPPEWPSGAYVAVLVERDAAGREHRPDVTTADGCDARALFVVRSARPGLDTPVLYKLSWLTFHAYNGTGYGSLYAENVWSRDDRPPGFKLTWRRPGGGTGGVVEPGDPPDAHEPAVRRQTFAKWDAPFIAWLERAGYRLDYCTDWDLHADPDLLAPYRLLLSVGHDEYWSDAMRGRLEGFVRRGGNVAFFSGNIAGFRVHFTDGDTAITCAKVPPPSGEAEPWTPDTWREEAVTGVSLRHAGGWWDGRRAASGYAVQHA